ncbi:MAG: hypothetical protein PHG85_02980 [Candidatus Altiarchaeota archaeon]|nr:hypothetical protein [Candidatus Altiarchaeota archaeon]
MIKRKPGGEEQPKHVVQPPVVEYVPKQAAPAERLGELAPKEVLTTSELRQRVRFVFRECSDREWNELRRPLHGLISRRGDVEKAGELAPLVDGVLRSGDKANPHVSDSVFKVVDRVIKTPGLMARVGRVYGRLSGIPQVSTAEAFSILENATPAERERILSFYPPTLKSDRNVELLRDRALGASHEELAVKYGLTEGSSKTRVHDILTTLVARPLAREAILEVQKSVESRLSPVRTRDAVIQNIVPDVPRHDIRNALKTMPAGSWDAMEKLMPLNLNEGWSDRERTAARGYFREGLSLAGVAQGMGLTVHGVNSHLGRVLNGLRVKPQARLIVLDSLAGSKRHIVKARSHLDPALFMTTYSPESAVDFDLDMMSYRDKFARPADMMAAGGLEYPDRLRGVLSRLPTGKMAGEDWEKKFYDNVHEMAGNIPIFASFLGTQPDFILARVVKHFDLSLKRFEKRTLGVEDVPRVALYCVLSNQVAAIQGFYDRADDVGKAFRKVGGRYRDYSGRIKGVSGDYIADLYSNV